MVVCVVWQLSSRSVLNQPSTFTAALSLFLMISVGLFGDASTFVSQSHRHIDYFF
ncbi:TRAP transporter small permease subunit [Escherichia coli]|uniref:TRAP transporter small permease subunit n=1 Tax=Escherichia coli TaxID=562 RepID=UPI003F53809F